MEVTHESGRVRVMPQDVESPPRTESLRHESLRVNVASQDVESPPRTDMSSESWRYESARVNFLPRDVESAPRTDLSSPSWRLSVQEFPAIAKSRVREGGFFTLQSLLHLPSKRNKVADYYEKQERLLEGFVEMETVTETGCIPGSLTEDEMQQLASVRGWRSMYQTWLTSLAVIASTLDSLLDLLSGFILWFTAKAMRKTNQDLLLESCREFISKTHHKTDSGKEKWMIGIMVSVTIVKFMLMVFCRKFKNEIVRSYAQDHFFDVITNSVGLVAAVLAIRYYWRIDPTGAIISGRVRLMPQDVESAPRPDMSSASWRLKSGRVKVVPQDVESPPRTESLRHESLRVNVAPQDVESPPRTDMSSESWRYESARVNFLPRDVESAPRIDLSSPSWRLSVQEFPAIAKSRVREGGKRNKVADYYEKQERLLEGFVEMETVTETGCIPGSLTEDEMQQLASVRGWRSMYQTWLTWCSLRQNYISLAVIASTLDSLLDLLSGFILWFTANAMRKTNQERYPIGKNRMQPTHHKTDSGKEKWMIGIMVSVTIVKFMLMVFCRKFKNEIVRAYAQDNFFDVITNSVGLVAAVLAIRYYWWIDPTGAIIIALYTMNTWTKTVIENVWSLIGRTAPPEFLAKLKYLIWNHHKDIKHIDTVRAYTFGSHYFEEVNIVLPKEMLLNKAHNIGESLQIKLEQLSEVERAFVHIDFECTPKPEHKRKV
ncbi:metal tolerance protein 9 [Quercus suber]|uniref:Metal tolerance protein 9 n=1 Tax=Quercus suber TaxID=58331 RepID=A0AAW0LIK9_QUESU